MKKSIVIGDIHINDKYNYKMFFEELNIFLEDEGLEYENVIFLGDFINDITKVKVTELYLIKEIVNTFLEKNKNIYILVGNHDILDVKKLNIFELILDYNPKVKILDKIEVINDCLFLPYSNQEEIKEVLYNFDLGKVNFIFSHNDFNDLYYTVSKDLDINISSVLKNYNHIKFISGHIHNWFIKNNIFVVGCSFNTNFSDRNLFNIILYIDENYEIEVIKYKTIVYLTFDIKDEEDIYKALKILSLEKSKKEVKFKVNSNKFEELKYKIEDVFDKELLGKMKILNVNYVKSFFEEENVLNIITEDIKDFTSSIFREDSSDNFIEMVLKYIENNFKIKTDNIKKYIEEFKIEEKRLIDEDS